jgi:hypothetical protein
MPPASKTTGNYVNSSLAKVEALKAGYDEAIMLNPAGPRQRVHRREHLRGPQRHHLTPPLSAGALEGITQNTVMTIARDLGYECEVSRSPAATCTSPRRCSCAAPPPRSLGQLGRRPCRSRAPAR